MLVFYSSSTLSGYFGHGQLTYSHCSWASLLGSLPVLNTHSFASNWQLPFLNQRKGENGLRHYFMTKLHERMLPDVRIEPTTKRARPASPASGLSSIFHWKFNNNYQKHIGMFWFCEQKFYQMPFKMIYMQCFSWHRWQAFFFFVKFNIQSFWLLSLFFLCCTFLASSKPAIINEMFLP